MSETSERQITLMYADCAFSKSAAMDAIVTGGIVRDGHFIVTFHDKLTNKDNEYHVLVSGGIALATLHRRGISHLTGNLQPLTQKFAALWKAPAVHI